MMHIICNILYYITWSSNGGHMVVRCCWLDPLERNHSTIQTFISCFYILPVLKAHCKFVYAALKCSFIVDNASEIIDVTMIIRKRVNDKIHSDHHYPWGLRLGLWSDHDIIERPSFILYHKLKTCNWILCSFTIFVQNHHDLFSNRNAKIGVLYLQKPNRMYFHQLFYVCKVILLNMQFIIISIWQKTQFATWV